MTAKNSVNNSVVSKHRALAAALRQRVLEGPGKTPTQVRQAAAQVASGGPSTRDPHDELARQIGESAHLVTDGQVATLLAVAGSEQATFEVIIAAAVGAGLLRWQQGMRALEEATGAPA